MNQGQLKEHLLKKAGYPHLTASEHCYLDGFCKASSELTNLTAKQAAITLDIEVGDTLLGGRFKNSPTVVKDIGTDGLGQPTINGKKLLAMRIKKLLPDSSTVNKEAYHNDHMQKHALPLSALLGMTAAAPLVGAVGYNAYKGVDDTLEGDKGGAEDRFANAGLLGLASLPFLGGAAAGVGHLGADLNRLSRGKGILQHGAGTLKKGLRAPGGLLAKGILSFLGPRRAYLLSKAMSRVGRASRWQPLHFLDRGVWGRDRAARAAKLSYKNRVPETYNPETKSLFPERGTQNGVPTRGFGSSLWEASRGIVPTIGASIGISALTQPKIDELDVKTQEHDEYKRLNPFYNIDKKWGNG